MSLCWYIRHHAVIGSGEGRLRGFAQRCARLGRAGKVRSVRRIGLAEPRSEAAKGEWSDAGSVRHARSVSFPSATLAFLVGSSRPFRPIADIDSAVDVMALNNTQPRSVENHLGDPLSAYAVAVCKRVYLHQHWWPRRGHPDTLLEQNTHVLLSDNVSGQSSYLSGFLFHEHNTKVDYCNLHSHSSERSDSRIGTRVSYKFI